MRNLFLALFIMLLPAPSFHCLGQTKAKEKLAVYVTGDVDPVYKKFIGSKLVSGITRSDGYTAVERTTDFLSELEREQNYQMSGVVNDSQIAKLGEQFGVRYVLISDINYLFDSMFISARLIDVQTAQIVNSYEVCQEVNDPESLSSISDALVSEMFGVQLSSSQISSGQLSSSSAGQDFTETVSGVSFDMVCVEGGTFEMGASYGDVFRVTLDSYYIGRHEVTQKLWVAVMGSNPSKFRGDDLPVENVSWHDVQKFITRLNSLTGKKYRLPTEAEWEYAARGGSNSMAYDYSGSDYLDNVGWYDGNSGERTHPVGTKLPNELGIYDMSGNVWEWCSDWYGSYPSSSQTNPKGPSDGQYKVLRGGSWNNDASHCRSANRNFGTPSSRYGNGGFRLALSL